MTKMQASSLGKSHCDQIWINTKEPFGLADNYHCQANLAMGVSPERID